jgi:glycerophosphoryl diester phosphodiesterase
MCIGHRGASAYNPENTMQSLERALMDGADGVEFDVHMTRDGTIVLLHDDTLERTTNGTGKVWDFDYNDHVKWLVTKDGKQPIPRFDQVLDWLRQHPTAQAIVDIKDTNPLEILDRMVDEIEKHSRAPSHDFRLQIIFGVWQAQYLDRAVCFLAARSRAD